MCEFSLVSVRKTRMQELAERGDNRAKMVLSALNNLPTYISATQFGITLVSLALGWIGEPIFAHLFAILLEPHLPDHLLFISSHLIAITISFILITFLQIIFGELAPKTTALQKPERFALMIIVPLVMFTTIFKPFVLLLRVIAAMLLKLLGFSTDIKKPAHSEEEIKMILAQSAASGIIDQHEVDMIYRVFRIGDLPVSTIMIPISDVVAFNEESTIEEIADSITQENMHTRFPIYEYSRKNIIGYVSVMDIYIFSQEMSGKKMLQETKLVREAIDINERTRIDDVLVMMKKKGAHLGVVLDANKVTIGIVSIEDIIESLVGEVKERK